MPTKFTVFTTKLYTLQEFWKETSVISFVLISEISSAGAQDSLIFNTFAIQGRTIDLFLFLLAI